MAKTKKPIPEKYRKAIEESREYLAKKKETANELNQIIRANQN